MISTTSRKANVTVAAIWDKAGGCFPRIGYRKVVSDEAKIADASSRRARPPSGTTHAEGEAIFSIVACSFGLPTGRRRDLARIAMNHPTCAASSGGSFPTAAKPARARVAHPRPRPAA